MGPASLSILLSGEMLVLQTPAGWRSMLSRPLQLSARPLAWASYLRGFLFVTPSLLYTAACEVQPLARCEPAAVLASKQWPRWQRAFWLPLPAKQRLALTLGTQPGVTNPPPWPP